MKRLITLPFIVIIFLLLLTTQASAKTYTLNFLAEESSSAIAPYKANITIANFWRFYRFDNAQRTGITLYRKVSRKCSIVVGARTSTGKDYQSESPNPQGYAIDELGLGEGNSPLLSGPLTNQVTNAGGIDLSPDGGWAFIKVSSTSGQPIFLAAGGYSSASKDEDEEYLLLGVKTQLSANIFGKCSTPQILKFRNSLPSMVRTVQVK